MKKLHEQIYVAGQINQVDFEPLKRAGIKTIINNRPDNEEPGQLSSDDAAKLAAENGIAYHYLPMVNGEPLTATLVEDFKTIIEASQGKVLAHCRSGMRSSFIWALGQIPTGQISVDDAIEKAQAAGIPLNNVRAVLESVQP
jgi:sulfide:quinone oxidoreductase